MNKKKEKYILTHLYVLWVFTIVCFIVTLIIFVASIASCFSQLSALKEDINKEQSTIKDKLTATLQYDVLARLEFLYTNFLAIGHDTIHPAPSCCAIFSRNSSSNAGYYWVRSTDGQVQFIFCNFLSCSNSFKAWKRVAKVNMTNTNETCPRGLMTHTTSGSGNRIRYCTPPNSICSSVLFSTNITYSQVYGIINGYGTGTLDSFRYYQLDINRNYIDGVSLTYNITVDNRQHIWSFASTMNCENCPYRMTPPSFVGSHFYCDSIEGNNILWNGTNCGLTASPWFYRQLSQPTRSDIEMRVCRDQNSYDENIGITYVEIYIQ